MVLLRARVKVYKFPLLQAPPAIFKIEVTWPWTSTLVECRLSGYIQRPPVEIKELVEQMLDMFLRHTSIFFKVLIRNAYANYASSN